jgi:hypothetical protein
MRLFGHNHDHDYEFELLGESERPGFEKYPDLLPGRVFSVVGYLRVAVIWIESGMIPDLSEEAYESPINAGHPQRIARLARECRNRHSTYRRV